MLSYSGLTSYGKVGIPSVESWGNSMNIMKDPPKSIYTKRKDKVGTTSHITQQIEDSGDRHNEAILKFARGVNQFTDIEYSNNGSNIGRDNKIVPGGVIQSKLRNRIMKDGDFRPPIISPQDLLPLSRPRRPNYSMVSNIDNVDFTQKPYSSEHKQKGREINKGYTTQSVASTKTLKTEQTIGQNMKDHIRSRVSMYVSSQVTNGGLHYDVVRGDKMNTTAVHEGILQGHYNTKIVNPMYQDNNNVDTNRYTQETFINPVVTSKTSKISNIIEDFEGDYTQVRDDIQHVSVQGVKSSTSNIPSQHNYQNDIICTRNVPNHSVLTNTKGTGSINNTTRQYNRLPDTLAKGSFMNTGNIPSTHKDTTINLRTTSKQELLNKMKTLS